MKYANGKVPLFENSVIKRDIHDATPLFPSRDALKPRTLLCIVCLTAIAGISTLTPRVPAQSSAANKLGIGRKYSTIERMTLERLRAAKPEVLWIGLRAETVPGFLQQYGRSGLAGELVGIAPDAIGLPNVDPAGLSGVWPVMWHHTLEKYSARDLNSRYRRRFGQPLEGASWSAWAALKLVGEAMLRAGTTPEALLEYLESDPPFDGHKGRPLTFRRWDHQLRQPMYLAQARKAAPGESSRSRVEVITEVPRGDLDAIVLPPRDQGCSI